MMALSPNRLSMNAEDYLQFDRSSTEARYEYIDGYVTMLAGGTLNHATISFNVAKILDSLLQDGTCRVYTSDARVQLSEERYVYPDVTVSCDMRDRGQIDVIMYPRLVVEVLSPSTEDYDRGRKFLYYRECPTIQEYVLVSAEYPLVEVCRREKKDLWSLMTIRPDSNIELVSLGIHFPLSALYKNVLFT